MTNSEQLYNSLLNKGYTEKNIGDRDTFLTKMQDKENRRKLYDFISKRGDFRIGNYDSYEQRIASDFSIPQPLQENIALAMAHPMDKVAPALRTQSAKPIGDVQASQNIGHRAEMTFNTPEQRSATQVIEDNDAIINSPSLIDSKVPKDPQDAIQQAVSQDLIGKATSQEWQRDVEKHYRSEKERLQELYNKEMEKVATQPTPNQFFAPGMVKTPENNRTQSREAYLLQQAIQYINDAEHHMSNVRNDAGLVQGVGDAIFDIDTLTLGLDSLAKNATLKAILDKADADQPLTQAEESLLNAALYKQFTEAALPNGRWYNIGKGIGENIPYMLQFALSGGVAGALTKGANKAIGKAVTKYINNLALKNGGKIANKATRALGNGISKLSAGTLKALAQTPLQTSLYNDIIERQIGTLGYSPSASNSEIGGVAESRGGLQYTGRIDADNTADAITKGLTSGFITNLTESIGGEGLQFIFNKLGGGIGKGIAKGYTKLTGKQIQSPRFYNRFREAVSKQGLKPMLDAVGFNGAPAEFAEEILDQTLNAIFVGDSSLDPNSENYVFDLDNLIDTAITTGAISLFMGAAGGIASGKIHRDVNKAYAQAEQNLRTLNYTDTEINALNNIATSRPQEASKWVSSITRTMRTLAIRSAEIENSLSPEARPLAEKPYTDAEFNELSPYDQQAVLALEEIKYRFNDLTIQRDYVVAGTNYNALIKGLKESVAPQAEAAMADIQANALRDSDYTVKVKFKGQDGYLVSGTAEINDLPDGSTEATLPAGNIYQVRTKSPDGQWLIQQAVAEDIQPIGVTPTQQLIDETTARIYTPVQNLITAEQAQAQAEVALSTEQTTPTTEQPQPTTPANTQDPKDPTVSTTTSPILEQATPIVEQTSPIVEQTSPIVEQTTAPADTKDSNDPTAPNASTQSTEAQPLSDEQFDEHIATLSTSDAINAITQRRGANEADQYAQWRKGILTKERDKAQKALNAKVKPFDASRYPDYAQMKREERKYNEALQATRSEALGIINRTTAEIADIDRYLAERNRQIAADREAENPLRNGIAQAVEKQPINTIEQYIARYIALGGRLRMTDQYTNGLAAELGITPGSQEHRELLSILSNTEGMTPEQLAQDMVENIEPEYRHLIAGRDTQDIRNAIINTIQSGVTSRKKAYDFIADINQRAADEEQRYIDEQEQQAEIDADTEQAIREYEELLLPSLTPDDLAIINTMAGDYWDEILAIQQYEQEAYNDYDTNSTSTTPHITQQGAESTAIQSGSQPSNTTPIRQDSQDTATIQPATPQPNDNSSNSIQLPQENKIKILDPRDMSDAEKQRRGDMLRNAHAVEVQKNTITSTPEISARKAAELWWDENVGEPALYNTEAGEVEINKNSIESSLAHRYGQKKLDAITSLIEGFENAVYLGTMPDSRERGVVDHYFAYPIMYDGELNYVFCRAMQDANKNRLYVHEVFLGNKITKGNTLQTAASKPHGGISLYRDILANVLSTGKANQSSSQSQEINEEINKQIAEPADPTVINDSNAPTTPNDSTTDSYTITPTQYTTKRGNVLDMQLVKFANDLTQEQYRTAKELAKADKGWYDREQGGFMMRSQESAQQLADTIASQPISMTDIKALNDGDIAFTGPQQSENKPHAPIWQYSIHVDTDGYTVLTREDVSSGIAVGDAHFSPAADSPEEMLEILRNPHNNMQEVLDAVGVILENRIKTREIDRKIAKQRKQEYEALRTNGVNGYKIGEKVIYKGKEATIHDFEEFGAHRPVLDTGMAPVIYEVAEWSDIEHLDKDKSPVGLNAPEATNSQEQPTNQGQFGLVSDDRMAELKERLRRKLGGQMNIGIDPEILSIGLEIAVGHIDRGIKSFTDFARVMINDLGDTIRPYLKAFYNGARDLPEVIDNGLATDMTPYDEVQQFDITNFDRTVPDLTATATNIAREAEVANEFIVAKQRIKRSTERKKSVTSTSNQLNLFDNTDNNNQDGLQRNDAVRSEGVSANGNRHEQVLSRGSETGSESEQQGSRGTDNGRETTGDAVNRTVRPRLSDTVEDKGIEGKRKKDVENNRKLADELKGVTLFVPDTFGVEHELSGFTYYELENVFQFTDNIDGQRNATRKELDAILKIARKNNGKEEISEPKNTRNNHSERGKDHAPTSVDARIEANIKAIELAKQLLESGEQASEKQMQTLRKFSGWGGLGKAFSEGTSYAPNNISKRLRELLGEAAYQEAEMSAKSAYYTPAYVVDTLWDIAEQMGFKGGNILEGSAGIGNILGQMPTHISERSNIHAIEIDGTSGGILSLLYPDAKVDIQGFEETRIANGSVDLAITNVPFVTGLRVYDTTGDKDLSKKFHNIHDFCIAKNVRKLREGGLGIFITSNGTLDNSKKLRDWIVNEGGADFVGAFRMHNKTFGGTGVTSDIIVIRKRVNGKKSDNAIDVSTVSGERMAEYDTGETRKVKGQIVPVVKQLSMDYNQYFVEHPENMAGEMHFAFEKGGTRRPTSKGLYPKQDKKQEQMLADFVQSFTAEEFGRRNEEDEINSFAQAMQGKKLGEMFVNDGELYTYTMQGAQPISANSNKVKGHTKVECFEAYSAIKEALAAVLAYQTENESNEGLQALLDNLNKAYDDFVATYGHFNKNTAIAFLRNDVDYANVFALEKYEETGDAQGNKVQHFGKTDVFSRRVVEKEKEPVPTNVKDGIVASIFKYGRIDVPYIAEHLNKSAEEVKQEIIESGYGFEDPATRQIEVSYLYLSGNVREKLRQAQENNENGVYDRNIKALQKVMPMDIPAHLIDFTLGSSWIEPKLYEEYVKERTEVDVQFTAVGGTWFMNEPYFTNYEKNRAMGVTSEMLGRTVMGHTLIEAAIQNRSITVSTTKKNWDGSTETITDKEATQACAAKIDEIRQDFKEWARQKMQSDAEMSERMERIYNDTFNNNVPMSIPDDFVPEYFGGASHKFKMRPHQGRAIVRGTMQPLLLAHEVGTGKTFTLISTAMEMRRLGTARKPMIVVQNATVGQFVASAKDLYPNAKILTLEEADRSAEGRKNFYAKIRYNDWDMIVVPQSTFEFIPDSEERQMTFVQEKIEEKMLVLEKMKEADPNGDSMITRQAEREIAALEEQLAELSDGVSKKRTAADEKKRAVALQNAEVKALEMLDRRTDDVENFDDMGIDALLIDEAHEYKHLGFATAMQRGVKGVDPSYSKKSQGVFLKTQAVLEKNNGRNVIFATGTPISNTAAEIWTFMRYLMPADTMEEYGIYYFDDFVRNFGNIQQMLEFTTSGKFKENNRFAGYVNLPELIRIWSGVSDTVLTKEAGGVSDKIPEMESGKAQDLYLPQTRALRSIMKFVKAELERYDKMSGKKKKENSHIPLTMYGIAKAAAVDARLVQSDAEDDTNSKTNEAVRQTLRSLQETVEYKGTVAIFADNYQNKESGFNLYEDIRAKLIAEGVPANEIVVMKSGMTVKKKLEIFEKVNRGEVRVILGSTFTLGTGVNIQERLHTLIHLDAPNRPMDYTQRNGRILRQGNLHKAMGKPVRILRFGVEDSLDVTAYQRLKTKGAIADSIMNGKQMMANSMTNRVLEEEADVFGDTVAQLSGSEYAMLKNNAEKNVRKYASRKKQWEADQNYIHNAKPRVKAFIKDAEKRIEDNSRYLEAVRSSFPDGKFKEIVIGKHRFTTIDAMEDFFKEHNKSLLAEMKQMKDGEIAGEQKRQLTIQIGDFSFVVTTKLTRQTVRDGATLFNDVERKMTYSCAELGIEDIPVRQNLLRNAIEDITHNVITGRDFSERLNAAERSKKHNEAELEQLLSREGKPFEYQAELEQAKAQYEEYAELMKKELEQKEAKYAEMDATVEVANDLATAEEADELEREGVGSYTDDEVSFENDPISKMIGKSRRTAKQRREFAERVRQRMVARVENLAKKLNLDNVEIVTDANSLKGNKQRAKGFYTKSTEKITIVIPNHTSSFDVEQTLLHEAVAHLGLRQLFGNHFDTFLDNVFNNADEAIRQRIVALTEKNAWDVRKATEEYLAMLAENTEFENTNASWWNKIKTLFLNMLHKIGFDNFSGVTLTDNELRYILWRSYENLAEPGKYRSILGEAKDVVMQNNLKVGNFQTPLTNNTFVADDIVFRSIRPDESLSDYARAVVANSKQTPPSTGINAPVGSPSQEDLELIDAATDRFKEYFNTPEIIQVFSRAELREVYSDMTDAEFDETFKEYNKKAAIYDADKNKIYTFVENSENTYVELIHEATHAAIQRLYNSENLNNKLSQFVSEIEKLAPDFCRNLAKDYKGDDYINELTAYAIDEFLDKRSLDALLDILSPQAQQELLPILKAIGYEKGRKQQSKQYARVFETSKKIRQRNGTINDSQTRKESLHSSADVQNDAREPREREVGVGRDAIILRPQDNRTADTALDSIEQATADYAESLNAERGAIIDAITPAPGDSPSTVARKIMFRAIGGELVTRDNTELEKFLADANRINNAMADNDARHKHTAIAESQYDSMQRLHNLIDDLRKQGALIDERFDPWLTQNQSRSRAQAETKVFDLTYRQPLYEAIARGIRALFPGINTKDKAENAKGYSHLSLYAQARTAVERQAIKSAQARAEAEEKGEEYKEKDFGGLAGIQEAIFGLYSAIDDKVEAVKGNIEKLTALATERGIPTVQEYIDNAEAKLGNPDTNGTAANQLWTAIRSISAYQLTYSYNAGLVSRSGYQTLTYGRNIDALLRERYNMQVQQIKDNPGSYDNVTDYDKDGNATGKRMVLNDNARIALNKLNQEYAEAIDAVPMPGKNGNWQRLIDTGWLTKEDVNSLHRYYMYYMPLKGHAELTAEDIVDYENKTPRNQSKIKAVEGHSHLAKDPFSQLILDTHGAIQNAEQNRWRTHLYNILTNNPNASQYVVEQRFYKIETKPDGSKEYEPYGSVETINGAQVFIPGRPTAEELANGTAVSYNNRFTRAEVDIPIRNYQRKEHSVTVMVDGEAYTMFFYDKRIADAINGTNIKRPSDIWKQLDKLQALNRLYAGLKTSLNPTFTLISNLPRDWMEMVSNNFIEHGFAHAVTSFIYRVRATRAGDVQAALRKHQEGKLLTMADATSDVERYVVEFFNNGGSVNITQLPDYNTAKVELMDDLNTYMRTGEMPKGNAWARGFNNMAERVELAPRLATYIASRTLGRNISQSVNDAKEATVNFDRKGSWSGIMGMFQLFYNAAAQSVRKQIGLARRHPVRFAATYATIGFLSPLNSIMASYISSLLLGDDDDIEDICRKYFAINPELRRRYFIILIGDDYIRIPMAVNYLPYVTLGDVIANWRRNPNYRPNVLKDTLDIASAILDTFLPSMIAQPIGFMFDAITAKNDQERAQANIAAFGSSFNRIPILEPLGQSLANYNFMGGTLFDRPFDKNSQEPAYLRARQYTQPVWVWASHLLNDITGGNEVHAGWLNIAPEQIENVMTVFGGYGEYGENIISLGIETVSILSGEKPDTEVFKKSFPLLSRLYGGNTQERYDKSMQSMFYDDTTALAQYAEYRKNATTASTRADFDRTYSPDEQRYFADLATMQTIAKRIRTEIKAATPEGEAPKYHEDERLKAIYNLANEQFHSLASGEYKPVDNPYYTYMYIKDAIEKAPHRTTDGTYRLIDRSERSSDSRGPLKQLLQDFSETRSMYNALPSGYYPGMPLDNREEQALSRFNTTVGELIQAYQNTDLDNLTPTDNAQ